MRLRCFYAIMHLKVGEDMQKEKLTVEMVNSDSKKLLKERYIELVELSFVELLFIVILFWIPISFLFYKIAFGCFAAIMLCLVVFQVLDIIKLHRALHNTYNIVKDKMISKEKRRYRRIRNRGYARLHFSNYGVYMIPHLYYSWNSMQHLAVYESSDYGDEFYLVLSKPHTGEILLAYNTKTFELNN